MAIKQNTKSKTTTKRAPKRPAKPATKKPKPNGAADPTASLESLTAVVADLNAKRAAHLGLSDVTAEESSEVQS